MTNDAGMQALDQLLAEAKVIVTVGNGGVGKTTLAAALGCRAVSHLQRRVLVMTVDPARRLADALGVTGLPVEPVLVPVDGGAGRLWVTMVDMASSWDALVARIAPDAETRDALLVNHLYRRLTTRFIASHDYVALDRLCELSDEDRYDLIIVDTPPSTHAIDVLDAPDKMTEFFTSRLLRWLTASYRSRIAQAAARPFLSVAERLLGGPFLAQIGEFFWLFSKLQPGFVERAEIVRARLRAADTHYVVVTTADPSTLARTGVLIDQLEARDHRPSMVIHNRASPAGDVHADDLQAIIDRSLAAAMAVLIDRDRAVIELVEDRRTSLPVVIVPWSGTELTSVAKLDGLLRS